MTVNFYILYGPVSGVSNECNFFSFLSAVSSSSFTSTENKSMLKWSISNQGMNKGQSLILLSAVGRLEMKIVLIRHGKTNENDQGILQGKVQEG